MDLVLDFVGGKVWTDSVRVIKQGRLLPQFNDGIHPDAHAAGNALAVRIEGPAVHFDQQQLTDIVKQADAGQLHVTIAKVYDFDQISEAHRALDDGHVSGQLVIRTW